MQQDIIMWHSIHSSELHKHTFCMLQNKKKQKQKKVQRTMHNILYIDVISTAMTHNAMLLSNLLLMKNENYMRV